jgi:hypothetical protein
MKTFIINEDNRSYEVRVKITQYENCRHCIELIQVDSDLLFTVCTVNMPEIDIKMDEVLIKDYAENEGVLHFLLVNDIVTLTDEVVFSGYVQLNVCILNPEYIWGISRDYEQYELNKYYFNN